MPHNKLPPLLEKVRSIAAHAGERIMEIYSSDFTVQLKSDHSPLTAADLAAHDTIVAELRKLENYPIISEESADIDFAKRSQWSTYWLVDPLDGTKEFVKRNGDFTVNIALIHQHCPILGVVYVPVTQTSYFAAEGLGAYKQIGQSQPFEITTRTLPASVPVIAGSRSHITPELENFLQNLPQHQLMSVGSSLKFCLVAEGKADLYPRLGLTSEWDTGAAQCIVEQAGGKVTDFSGQALMYNTKASYLNPFFLVYGDICHEWTQYARA